MQETIALSPSQPNLVVGWASGLLQVWPAEDLSIALPASSVRRPRRDDHELDTHRLAS